MPNKTNQENANKFIEQSFKDILCNLKIGGKIVMDYLEDRNDPDNQRESQEIQNDHKYE